MTTAHASDAPLGFWEEPADVGGLTASRRAHAAALIEVGFTAGQALDIILAEEASFDAGDWQPHVLKRGPRKGQTVYKNQKTGGYRDEPPGEKKGKGDAGGSGGDKPAPAVAKPGPDKPEPKAGKPDADGKAKDGKGGAKAPASSGPWGASLPPNALQGKELPHKEVEDNIVRSMGYHKQFKESQDGVVSIAHLWHTAKNYQPDLTVDQFHRVLDAMSKDRKLSLHGMDSPGKVPDKDKALCLTRPDASGNASRPWGDTYEFASLPQPKDEPKKDGPKTGTAADKATPQTLKAAAEGIEASVKNGDYTTLMDRSGADRLHALGQVLEGKQKASTLDFKELVAYSQNMTSAVHRELMMEGAKKAYGMLDDAGKAEARDRIEKNFKGDSQPAWAREMLAAGKPGDGKGDAGGKPGSASPGGGLPAVPGKPGEPMTKRDMEEQHGILSNAWGAMKETAVHMAGIAHGVSMLAHAVTNPITSAMVVATTKYHEDVNKEINGLIDRYGGVGAHLIAATGTALTAMIPLSGTLVEMTQFGREMSRIPAYIVAEAALAVGKGTSAAASMASSGLSAIGSAIGSALSGLFGAFGAKPPAAGDGKDKAGKATLSASRDAVLLAGVVTMAGRPARFADELPPPDVVAREAKALAERLKASWEKALAENVKMDDAQRKAVAAINAAIGKGGKPAAGKAAKAS